MKTIEKKSRTIAKEAGLQVSYRPDCANSTTDKKFVIEPEYKGNKYSWEEFRALFMNGKNS